MLTPEYPYLGVGPERTVAILSTRDTKGETPSSSSLSLWLRELAIRCRRELGFPERGLCILPPQYLLTLEGEVRDKLSVSFEFAEEIHLCESSLPLLPLLLSVLSNMCVDRLSIICVSDWPDMLTPFAELEVLLHKAEHCAQYLFIRSLGCEGATTAVRGVPDASICKGAATNGEFACSKAQCSRAASLLSRALRLIGLGIDTKISRAVLHQCRAEILKLRLDHGLGDDCVDLLWSIEIALVDETHRRNYAEQRLTLSNHIGQPYRRAFNELLSGTLSFLASQKWMFAERRIRRFRSSAAKRSYKTIIGRSLEGASISDALFGYTRAAPAFKVSVGRDARPKDPLSLGVHIHAYYMDTLIEFLDLLSFQSYRISRIYITCRLDIKPLVEALSDVYSTPITVIIMENRGRDVRPFFCIVPRILADGCDVILKLHTKKSLHGSVGEVWRRSFLEDLLTPSSVSESMERFRSERELGMVVSARHLLLVSETANKNKSHLIYIANSFKMEFENILKSFFSAGTMFYIDARLASSLSDHIDYHRFEPESGQTDSTYAHAVERIFIAYAQRSGWIVRDASGLELVNTWQS